MDRRKFVKNSSLAMAGLMINPIDGLSQEPRFGHGPKRYKIDTRWSQADVSKTPVNDCHEMVQDAKGRIILLTNETKNNVMIYDKGGKLLSYWGTTYPGAHGLTLFNENGTDVLFICDNNRHQVIKTTVDGRELMVLDYPKEAGIYSKADEYVPTETTIAPNGDIFVADGYGKDYILHYDAKGKFLGYFGGRGAESKHLKNAHGVCFDNRDKKNPCLIVTSREENAFKRYDLKGNYLNTIALPGAWVCRPVIKGDYLYAAVLQSSDRPWQSSGFITILDKNNKVVSNPGGNEPVYKNGVLQPLTQLNPLFAYPHDVCVDDEENIYVAQWNSRKVYPYKLTPVV
ncbi:peptidylglycine monooxygenase-like protein [Flavihumibacter cheonanensis]|uniref:6-bladed beta-propeller n=1 Tax=Flavihumibacter cheonanensis TaxID=1442385 RepID=UPI001EF7F542|nr:6-bladed beta-propeller [Flavihumibacter cheonanensis]MCG7754210.1 6-bladed beta-propeller [Flavihumibacter cheonanensis]